MLNRHPLKRKEEPLVSNFERNRLYQEHRARVQNAKPCVNSHAPRRANSSEGPGRELDYIEMMAEMNGAARRANKPRTFSKAPQVAAAEGNRHSSNTCRSPWPFSGYAGNWEYGYPWATAAASYCYAPYKQSRARSMLTMKNGEGSGGGGDQRKVGQKLSAGHCRKDTASAVVAPSQSSGDTRKDGGWDIADHVMQRYEHLTPNRQMLRRLLRPRVFFDLEVKGDRPLGRLVVQLYTEACPEVVLEFVRVCTDAKSERIAFTRFFPPMWCEGKIELTDHRTLTMPAIEHDENVLDHGSGPGILSFPSRYVRGSKCRFLTFSLSFKPLKVLNGRRIAFGRVRRGMRLLDGMQDFAQSNNGKPARDIVLTKCGMLK